MESTDIGEIKIDREITDVVFPKRIRNLDEQRLNVLLDTIPNADLRALIFKPPNSKMVAKQKKRVLINREKLPNRLTSIITTLGLLDETDYSKRLYIFAGYCRYMNYSVNTATKYFNLMKTHGLFGTENTHLTIDKSSFVDSGKVHTRTFSFEAFKKFLLYLHQNFTKFTAPILLACYSGLRTFEILQFSNITLHQLAMKQTTVSIFRKKTFRYTSTAVTTDESSNEWRPIYTTHLNRFIIDLTKLYNDEFEAYKTNGIIVKLFPITPKTLCSRLRSVFFLVNGYKLPLGAGIHSLRNMLAMLMAQQTENVWAIQHMLQHKNSQTTRRYIHADFTHISREFDRLTATEFSDVKKILHT